jgi:cob(I)alamin adenosyltransferase
MRRLENWYQMFKSLLRGAQKANCGFKTGRRPGGDVAGEFVDVVRAWCRCENRAVWRVRVARRNSIEENRNN